MKKALLLLSAMSAMSFASVVCEIQRGNDSVREFWTCNGKYNEPLYQSLDRYLQRGFYVVKVVRSFGTQQIVEIPMPCSCNSDNITLDDGTVIRGQRTK